MTTVNLDVKDYVILNIFDYELTYPIVSTYTNTHFYVQAKKKISGTFFYKLLTLQYAESSFNYLYYAITLPNEASIISAVSGEDLDIITVICNNELLTYGLLP